MNHVDKHWDQWLARQPAGVRANIGETAHEDKSLTQQAFKLAYSLALEDVKRLINSAQQDCAKRHLSGLAMGWFIADELQNEP